MSSDEVAIRVANLGKCYQIYGRPQDRLKQSLVPRLRRLIGRPAPTYFQEFWALRDISLQVRKGETVGIIGRNGSGKSTLLQIICGTLTPTTGTVETNGRVAALLELGAGFNPEFTGRENVYLNGSVLGLSLPEIDERFDAIAAFADIGGFIEQPVKMYSTGMVVRLAFAIQAQVDPDILVVDEALAVGDARFQAKCFDRLKRLKDSGTAILLVTHSGDQIVTHCSNAILLNDGGQLESGEPRRVVNRYMDLLFGREKRHEPGGPLGAVKMSALSADNGIESLSCDGDLFSTRPGYTPHEYRWGDGAAAILDYCLIARGQSYPSSICSGDEIVLAVTIRFYVELVRPILGITIKTKEGVTVYGVNTETLDCEDFQSLGRHATVAHAQAIFTARLAPGDYFISLGIASHEGEEIIPHDRRYDSIHVHVEPTDRFFGLADLGLSLTAREIHP